MASFEENEELEQKLKQDPRELDEDELQDVQIYKSQKLQALRDSGESGDRPDWWSADQAPQTMDELAGAVGVDGAEVPAGTQDGEEEPKAEAAEEAPEEETEETQPDETEEATTEEATQATEDAEAEAEEPVEEEATQASAEPEATAAEVELGGEALESLQETLDDLVERVEALQEQDGVARLEDKVDEIYELLFTTRDVESKLAKLPPLPTDEELVEAGILDEPIEHDTSDNCFYTSIDNRKAALHYGPKQDRLTVYHYNLPTILSETLRHTVEDVLARALFEHAEDENKVVHPQLPRLRSGFLARHPEYVEQTTGAADSARRRRAL